MSSVTTTRPSGKVYRPRRAPRLEEFSNYDGMTCVAVMGTHDIEVAYRLAWSEMGQLELDPDDVTLTWWRLVPWDHTGMFDRSYITDTERGTPAVVWGIS